MEAKIREAALRATPGMTWYTPEVHNHTRVLQAHPHRPSSPPCERRARRREDSLSRRSRGGLEGLPGGLAERVNMYFWCVLDHFWRRPARCSPDLCLWRLCAAQDGTLRMSLIMATQRFSMWPRPLDPARIPDNNVLASSSSFTLFHDESSRLQKQVKVQVQEARLEVEALADSRTRHPHTLMEKFRDQRQAEDAAYSGE